jgi:hypothetical protein
MILGDMPKASIIPEKAKFAVFPTPQGIHLYLNQLLLAEHIFGTEPILQGVAFFAVAIQVKFPRQTGDIIRTWLGNLIGRIFQQFTHTECIARIVPTKNGPIIEKIK